MVSKGIFATIAIILILMITGGIYMTQQAPTPTTTPKAPTTSPSLSPAETPEEPPNNAADGEILYRQNCAGCHGSKGVGSMGPALSARNVDRNKIENGIADAGMPVFKKILTPEEITAIINFLKS